MANLAVAIQGETRLLSYCLAVGRVWLLREASEGMALEVGLAVEEGLSVAVGGWAVSVLA